MSNDAGAIAEGGCQCGAIRFRLTAPPGRVYCCHCTECRRQSASAFGLSVIVPPGGVTVTRGVPREWSRPTRSGGSLACAFCPDCGSRLWHRAKDCVSVKGGALDTVPDPTAHIWTGSKLLWVVIPDGVERWVGEPRQPF